ncbi:DUF3653 domain-containing protein [Xanthomonas theicola]|nr:DUF3653 domain-containing protein [Xanthomonas theicola]
MCCLGHQWRDFHVAGGVLVTPEGHQFPAADLSWWSLWTGQPFVDIRTP